MINKSNYEAYALDYLEGNLSATERREMEIFLQNHPIIAEELVMMSEMATLVPDETVVFANKNALLKSEGGAKIVAMHRRTWFRMSIAAAAMLLLIGGYLAGYFMGNTEIGKEIIVVTPERPTDDMGKLEEATILVVDEEVSEKEEIIVPNSKEIEQKTTPKSPPQAPNKKVEKYEAVAKQEVEVKNYSPKIDNQKQSILQQSNVKKEEETAIAQEEIPTPSPQKVIPPTNEEKTEITIATLPEKAVAIDQLPQENTIEEALEEMAHPIAMTEIREQEIEVKEISKGKKKLRKIGRFLGKLPFEGATASIIPTYYTDKKNEGK